MFASHEPAALEIVAPPSQTSRCVLIASGSMSRGGVKSSTTNIRDKAFSLILWQVFHIPVDGRIVIVALYQIVIVYVRVWFPRFHRGLGPLWS